MGHRELSASDSHLEEWASLLGTDIDTGCDSSDADLLDEQDDRA
ncbi:hypothetical protein ACOZ4I_17020 [Haloarcula salina]